MLIVHVTVWACWLYMLLFGHLDCKASITWSYSSNTFSVRWYPASLSGVWMKCSRDVSSRWGLFCVRGNWALGKLCTFLSLASLIKAIPVPFENDVSMIRLAFPAVTSICDMPDLVRYDAHSQVTNGLVSSPPANQVWLYYLIAHLHILIHLDNSHLRLSLSKVS